MKQNYSVLMSVYYKENPSFLQKSIESILNQSVKTNDFVLICDGPLTKELDSIIKEYADLNKDIFNIIRLEKNSGLGNALSIGIKEAKNELVARMDSDDISELNRCEEQLNVFQKMNVDVVGTNIAEFDETMSRFIDYRIVPENDLDIKKFAKKRNPMNHVTVMFKKNAIIDSGGYETMMYFEDYYLWARMIKKEYKFYNIQKSLVKVRGGNDMVLRRGGLKYIKCIMKFEKELFKMKLINYFQYIVNVCERIIISIIPNCFRFLIYKKILRKEKTV